MTTIEEIVAAKIPKYENISGPFTDNFDGKEFYIGELEGMKVKFNLKVAEYGKQRII